MPPESYLSLVHFCKELQIDFLLRLKTVGTELRMLIRALDYLCTKTLQRQTLRENNSFRQNMLFEDSWAVLKEILRDYELLLFDFQSGLIDYADLKELETLRKIIKEELQDTFKRYHHESLGRGDSDPQFDTSPYCEHVLRKRRFSKQEDDLPGELNKNQEYFISFLSKFHKMNLRLTHIIKNMGHIHVITNERQEVFPPEAFPRYFMRENYTFYGLFDKVIKNYAESVGLLIANYFVDRDCYPEYGNGELQGSSVEIDCAKYKFASKLSSINITVSYDYINSSRWNPGVIYNSPHSERDRIIIQSPIWYLSSTKYSLNLVHELVHAMHYRWLNCEQTHYMDNSIRIELESAKSTLNRYFARENMVQLSKANVSKSFVEELFTDVLSFMVSGPFYIQSMLYDAIGCTTITPRVTTALDPIVRANILVGLAEEFSKISFFQGSYSSSTSFNNDFYFGKESAFSFVKEMFNTYIKAHKLGLPVKKDLSDGDRSRLARKGEFLENVDKILFTFFKNIVRQVARNIAKTDKQMTSLNDHSTYLDYLKSRPHIFFGFQLNRVKETDYHLGGNGTNKYWLKEIEDFEKPSSKKDHVDLRRSLKFRKYLSKTMSIDVEEKFLKFLSSQVIQTILNLAKYYWDLDDKGKNKFLKQNTNTLLVDFCSFINSNESYGKLLKLTPGLSAFSVGNLPADSEWNDINRRNREKFFSLSRKLNLDYYEYLKNDNHDKNKDLFDLISEMSPDLKNYIELASSERHFCCVNLYQTIFHNIWLFRHIINRLLEKTGVPEEEYFRKLPEVSCTFEMFEIANRFILKRYHSLGRYFKESCKNGKIWKNLYIPDFSEGKQIPAPFKLDKRQLVAFNYYFIYWEPDYNLLDNYKKNTTNISDIYFFNNNGVFHPDTRYTPEKCESETNYPGKPYKKYSILQYLSLGHFDGLTIVSAAKQSQTISYDVLKPIRLDIIAPYSPDKELSNYVVRQPMQIIDLSWDRDHQNLSSICKIVRQISDYGCLITPSAEEQKHDQSPETPLEAIINLRFERDNFEKNRLSLNIQRIGEKRAIRNLYLLIALIQAGELKSKKDNKIKPLNDSIKLKELYHSMGWYDYAIRVKINDPFKLPAFLKGLMQSRMNKSLNVEMTPKGDFFQPLIESTATHIITRTDVHPDDGQDDSESEETQNNDSATITKSLNTAFYEILKSDKFSTEELFGGFINIGGKKIDNNNLSFIISAPTNHKNIVHLTSVANLAELPFFTEKPGIKTNREKLDLDIDDICNSLCRLGIINFSYPTGYENLHYKVNISRKLINEIRNKTLTVISAETPGSPSVHNILKDYNSCQLRIFLFIRAYINSVMMYKHKLHTINTSLELDPSSFQFDQKEWGEFWKEKNINSLARSILMRNKIGIALDKGGDDGLK